MCKPMTKAYAQHHANLTAAGVRKLAAEIARALIPELKAAGSDEQSWRFTDGPTGREFWIRRSNGLDDAGRELNHYHLSEFVPNGVVCVEHRGEIIPGPTDVRVRETEKQFGPNTLYQRLVDLGIDVPNLVRVGGGYGIDSIYHESLDACALAIARSLARNERYNAYKAPTQQDKLRRERAAAQQTLAYWQDQREQLQAALRNERGIFKGCLSMLGPLSADSKERILAYLNAPDQQAWLEVRGLVITGSGTLWQAWCESDPKAPRSGNVGFPDREQLQEAIRHAVQAAGEKIEERLAQAQAKPNGLSVV